MILFLCYVFPPLAVLCMGKPFSAILNFFFTIFMWAPGVRHALVCYADYKVNDISKAIHNPKWTRESAAPQRQTEQRAPRTLKKAAAPIYDNPCIGKNGTVFRSR